MNHVSLSLQCIYLFAKRFRQPLGQHGRFEMSNIKGPAFGAFRRVRVAAASRRGGQPPPPRLPLSRLSTERVRRADSVSPSQSESVWVGDQAQLGSPNETCLHLCAGGNRPVEPARGKRHVEAARGTSEASPPAHTSPSPRHAPLYGCESASSIHRSRGVAVKRRVAMDQPRHVHRARLA
jgi:hypothetical protein